MIYNLLRRLCNTIITKLLLTLLGMDVQEDLHLLPFYHSLAQNIYDKRSD